MAEETENTAPDDEAVTPDDASRSQETESVAEETGTRQASSEAPTSSEDASSSAPASAPQSVLAPKERRARARASKAAKVKPRAALSPEERQAERVVIRAKKAELRRAGRLKARTKARAAEHQAAVTPPREHAPGTQKTRQGVVVSDKADKTITVRIELSRRHRKYQKIVSTRSTLHAHDETNDAHIGDTVIVRESRPLSRSKRWRLVEVVERAK
jgi:small subunit ribosomal protein S17